MQQNQNQSGDPVQILLLIAAILLTALLLYLATRIVTGHKDTESTYMIKILLSAILIWILIIVVGALVGALGNVLSQAATVIIFTGAIYIVKLLIMPSASGRYDVWERSIWIALLTFIFIYIVNYISGTLGYELIYFL